LRADKLRVEFVEPFVKAAFVAIQAVAKAKPTRGQLAIRSSASTSQQIAILVSVSGDIEGKVLYGMSIVTAQKLASSVLGCPVMSFDEVAQNTMTELGNTIVENAGSYLVDAGFTCNFSSVNVVRASDEEIEVEKNIPTLVVPMLTQHGRIEIDVALIEKSSPNSKAA
jgi:chemotaxis protein CheX